jgi:hypothetical protein
MGGTGRKASTEDEKLTGPVSVPVLRTQNCERGDRNGSGGVDDRLGQKPMTALGQKRRIIDVGLPLKLCGAENDAIGISN